MSDCHFGVSPVNYPDPAAVLACSLDILKSQLRNPSAVCFLDSLVPVAIPEHAGLKFHSKVLLLLVLFIFIVLYYLYKHSIGIKVQNVRLGNTAWQLLLDPNKCIVYVS